jgi:hypothetical protein
MIPKVNILLLALFTVGFVTAFGSGKFHEQRSQELRFYKQLQNAVVEMERQRAEDIEIIMAGTNREPNLRETIREIRVPVATPDCTDLGAEWVRNANKIVGADSR